MTVPHPSLAVALLCLAACAPAPSAATKFLSVTLVLPKNPDGVFLNEPVVVFFSGELDRSSVTNESVSIRSSDGIPARGSIAVSGDSLTFTPAPVLAADLSDGGYRPDTQYTVEIHGFPWVDGLRGSAGEPLRETHSFSFRTVSAAPPIETLLFVDTEPDKTRPLGFFPPPGGDAYSIGTDDAIYLDSDKPIDPSSVRDTDFVLAKIGKPAAPPVAVRARLHENESESRARRKPRRAQSIAIDAFWEGHPRAALLELVPVKKLQPGSRYRLALARDAIGPRDFSGHVLWNAVLGLEISVGDRGPNAGKGVLYEDFLTDQLARPGAVPETVGLARWSNSGRVEVRFPRAAGLGTAGHVSLVGAVEGDDLHTVSLTVAAGERVTLPASRGLVVLRSQGAMRIRGQVSRDVQTGQPEPPLELRASSEQQVGSVRLTDWLEEMRARKVTVTVLVAGGDLVIEESAELRSNAPLVLVAGGRVRVLGNVRGPLIPATSGPEAAGASVWVLGDGGSKNIQPSKADATLLYMDPPDEGNPLVEPLHYAILSSPLPQLGSVASWTSAEASGSPLERRTGNSTVEKNPNRWSVRYVREITGEPLTLEELAPVDRPQALEPVGSIQILIELWVAPGPKFEPPFVDFVRLAWEAKLVPNGVPR